MQGAAGAAAGVAAGSALTSATAGAAGSTTSGGASAGAAAVYRSVEVAVVGAGISGLVAARRLQQKGHSVAVLEALGRTGGRILNASVGDGQVVEAGAEFMGAQDAALRKLVIDELKLPYYDTFDEGDALLDFHGTVSQLSAWNWPLVPPDKAAEMAALVQQLDEMAFSVPLLSPQSATNAVEWDRQNLQTWLTANTSDPDLVQLASLASLGLFGGTPSDASLLHFLLFVHGHGGVVATGAIQGGAQQNRITGGSGRISDALARLLGDSVLLETPVHRITYGSHGAVLTTDRGNIKAQKVIVAVPPTLAGRMDYHPQLSALRDQLTQRMPMGYAMKIHAVYPEPYWRDNDLSGAVLSDTGPVTMCFDNSPNGADATMGVLLGFVFGENGRLWGPRSKHARKAAVLAQFERWFGPPPGGVAPSAYLEQDWAAQRWTRGYAGYMPTDVWTGGYAKSVRAPVGPIHWAGTETGGEGIGAMNGAILAAERAVKEIIG